MKKQTKKPTTRPTTLPTVAPQGAKAGAVATVKAVKTPPTDDQAANAIRALYRDVLTREEEAFWARARLGAMLIRWEEFLGKSNAGCKSAGEGLKGWLEKNCPEIGYKSACSYKDSARMAVTMIGGGAVAVAALLGESEVTQPDGEVIDVPCEVVEKRDKLYKDVKSRRKLEQAYFAFMAEGEKPKPKKEVKPLPKLSQRDEAKAIWNGVMVALSKSSVRDAIPLLGEKETQVCHDGLMDLLSLLKKHLKEF